MTRLHQLALALPRPGCDWEDRPRFEPPATPQSMVELEHMAGFVLPGDLREFLESTESIVAMSVHNGYWLGGINKLINEASLPRVADGEAAIPVATDGGGNAFLLGARARKRCQVPFLEDRQLAFGSDWLVGDGGAAFRNRSGADFS